MYLKSLKNLNPPRKITVPFPERIPKSTNQNAPTESNCCCCLHNNNYLLYQINVKLSYHNENCPKHPSGYHMVNDTTNMRANVPYITIHDIRTYVHIHAYE